ncbi:hypothetical protein SAMN05660461_6012 [Chitinophaga ginsengisegetis]|uniref:Terminase-like family protein n=1 Tax=Chitinophaga ginsengisegetis TaxID=393003 RepID=A0A1T5PBU2_9BACT|nr:hypothetical protein [Chitinophaga ginsengisegetis]SKD10112.1 hypothetical protein SAMN05660461_6012 [Chitinophaga ginsengisegetis]
MIEKNFSLNTPQAIVAAVNANKTHLVWARGTGKTTGVIGPKSLDLVHKMPRAKGGFIGKDYEQIFDRTLPGVVSVWEQLGYYQEKHWRLGKPLSGWDTPIIPPMKWDNIISWYNGTAIHLLSLAVKAAGNGLSLQWLMGDESKFWKKEQLNEILKTLRGLAQEFGHLPEYCGYLFATDKWMEDIADVQWILDEKQKMNPEAVNLVLDLQLEINRIRTTYADLTEAEQEKANRDIRDIEKVINPIRKKLFFYSEASAEDNVDILGPDYISSQKAELEPEEFDVAIRNHDPKKTKNCFYPTLTDGHKYASTKDLDIFKPLIIAPDYQASISPIVTAQIAQLPTEQYLTLNMARSTFVLQPLSLIDACKLWAERHKHFKNKVVYYVYDHTAIGRNALQKPFYTVVKEVLESEGWIVFDIYMGKAPEHDIKYEKIKAMYEVQPSADRLAIRHNSLAGNECIVSMERAKAITERGKTKKDKKHEDVSRYPKYPQQYATHFSDCADMILWAVMELNLIPLHTGTGEFSSGYL